MSRSPASIVEPLIAASIVYVAVENVLFTRMTPWRTVIVFCFGLLHGLGFASVLGEIGLNPARFISGLIGFNIGVELGQLTVILGAFPGCSGCRFGKKSWYRARIAIPASCRDRCGRGLLVLSSGHRFLQFPTDLLFEVQLHVQQHPLQFQRLAQ